MIPDARQPIFDLDGITGGRTFSAAAGAYLVTQEQMERALAVIDPDARGYQWRGWRNRWAMALRVATGAAQSSK